MYIFQDFNQTHAKRLIGSILLYGGSIFLLLVLATGLKMRAAAFDHVTVAFLVLGHILRIIQLGHVVIELNRAQRIIIAIGTALAMGLIAFLLYDVSGNDAMTSRQGGRALAGLLLAAGFTLHVDFLLAMLIRNRTTAWGG